MALKDKPHSLTVDNNNHSNGPCSIDDDASHSATISPLSEETVSPISVGGSTKHSTSSPNNVANNEMTIHTPLAANIDTYDLPSPNGSVREIMKEKKRMNSPQESTPQPSAQKLSPDKDSSEPPNDMSEKNDNSIQNRYHPIKLTLDFLDGLGSFVETLFFSTCHFFNGSDDDEDDDNTLCTYERDQLLDDIYRFERMNSFDTFGTMNTAGTMNTYTTTGTNDTGSTNDVTIVSAIAVDDDGNVIPADVIKEHLIRKQVADKLNESSLLAEAKEDRKEPPKKIKKKRRKKKKKRKVVGFEYPPISKMKDVPRVSSTERKDLFFTEDELNRDSSSESDLESSDDDILGEQMSNNEIVLSPKSNFSPASNLGGGEGGGRMTSALRQGKFSKKEVTQPDAQNTESNDTNDIVEDSKQTVNLIRFVGRRLRRNRIDSLDEGPPILTPSKGSTMSD